MKKAYYLLFYKLYSFFKSISDDGFAEWKALLITNVLQAIIIIEFYTWCDIIFRSDNFEIPYPRTIIVFFGFILTGCNYYLLMHNDKWKVYQIEFKKHSIKQNKINNLLIFLFIILVLGSMIFAFYQMSLLVSEASA